MKVKLNDLAGEWKDVLIQGCVDGWTDRRKLREKWRITMPWATLFRKILILIANIGWLKLEVSSLALNPSKHLLFIEITFSGELKLRRDARRILKTPLPVETITCPFTGKKEANISDESRCCTNTVYNVGDFGFFEQYLGRLSAATRRVSVIDWWFRLYD
jgi:hypothetical protein